MVVALRDDDFELDEKARSVTMTKLVFSGRTAADQAGLMEDGSLYDIANVACFTI